MPPQLEAVLIRPYRRIFCAALDRFRTPATWAVLTVGNPVVIVSKTVGIRPGQGLFTTDAGAPHDSLNFCD